MIESHDYPVSLRWTTSRQGKLQSPDGLPVLTVGAPPEFGGEPRMWSPEHLFVASVASCFLTTFVAIAERSQLEVLSAEIEASGHLERGEDRRYSFTEIVLRPRVTLTRERDRERATRLLAKSEEHCLVTRSIRSAVRLESELRVSDVSSPATVGVA
jgi:peroxiredoxin-like protein